MVVWRCPHCATPQAEAARCWVCHRSTTSCASCRHFRRSVASTFGICGLDPRRVALTGAEMRACWTAPHPVPDDTTTRSTSAPASQPVNAGRVPRTFVPVEDVRGAASRDVAATPVARPALTAAPKQRAISRAAAPTVRWSLWDEPER